MDNNDRETSQPGRTEISGAIARLKSLHIGDRVLVDVVRLGPKVVPDLKKILFERDPSGLFHTRCRAVEALTQLRAYDILAEFLRFDRRAVDPVERLGDDVVVGNAARGISKSHEEWVFRLLMMVAQRHVLNGVINALGAFRREEAIPILIDALAEDETRAAASSALRSIGAAARSSLIEVTLVQSESYASHTRRRQRQSAMSLLLEIGVPKKLWPQLRQLMYDDDPQISLLACGLCLSVGGRREQQEAISELQRLRRSVGWFEQQLIDSYLNR